VKYAAENPRLIEVTGTLGAIAARNGDRAEAEALLGSLERMKASNRRRNPELFYADAIIRAALDDPDGAIHSLRDWIGGQGWDLHAATEFE
jgi:hypothetical protein